MNILMLCDRVPASSSDGLLLRVLNLARELAPRHHIDLLCLRPPEGGEVAAAPGLFERVWMVPSPPPRAPGGPLAPLRGWGPEALYVPSPELRQVLQTAIDPADYDVIWDAGAVLFAQLPPRWAAVPVVADLVDDMVLTFRRASRSAPRWMDKLRNRKYAHVFGRFEREVMAGVARCVVVSEEDAASFARVSPYVPVSVVANGVDTAFYTPDDQAPVPGRLVFEGTMAFPPNEQAAQFLVHQVAPRIWQRRPDATVSLVGRDPGPAVRALAGGRVQVTGSVEDVRDHVRQAEVFVCPLVSGAGIKNKLLQAWAMERAVVATSVSTGGLGARDGVELLVRDGADAFAGAVVELLDDAARRRALGRAGREAAVVRFAWAAMARAFEILLAQAASQRPAGALTRPPQPAGGR